jgi:hypothetical protein
MWRKGWQKSSEDAETNALDEWEVTVVVSKATATRREAVE